jgi:hypothetical protein
MRKSRHADGNESVALFGDGVPPSIHMSTGLLASCRLRRGRAAPSSATRRRRSQWKMGHLSPVVGLLRAISIRQGDTLRIISAAGSSAGPPGGLRLMDAPMMTGVPQIDWAFW